MIKHRVKYFASNSSQQLEMDINAWLSELDASVKIITISHSHAVSQSLSCSGSSLSNYHNYSALILWQQDA